MIILKETRQSGAYKILMNGLQKQFLNMEINWYGHVQSLKETFPRLTQDDADAILFSRANEQAFLDYMSRPVPVQLTGMYIIIISIF